MRTFISALAALALTGVACKSADRDDQTSAQRSIEEAQETSAAAYDRAKQVQEKAADEAREAARAAEKVDEKRQELMEAEGTAARSQAEAQAAQQQARAEGEAAHQEAQHSQDRAAAAQEMAAEEAQARETVTVRRSTITTHDTAPRDVHDTAAIGREIQDRIDFTVQRLKDGHLDD